MKTYVVELEAELYFYPPLTGDEKKAIYNEYLFQPLRNRATSSNGELLIKEELGLIGWAIVDASEEAAKNLRLLGFHLVIKKTR